MIHGKLTQESFRFHFYDLFSPNLEEMRQALGKVAESILPGQLRGPLNAWVFELAANALKATYKRVYQISMLEPLGLEDIQYEKWLKLFKTELEEHSAENFAHYCRENDIFVEVTGKPEDDFYRVEIINDGAPSEEERDRIKKALKKARQFSNPEMFFEDDDTGRKEGGGIGLSLIIMGMRGLGLGVENFKFVVKGNRTITRLDLPYVKPGNLKSSDAIQILSAEQEIGNLLLDLFRKNDLGIVRFTKEGQILDITSNILKQLNYPGDDYNLIRNGIPRTFLMDIFHGARGIRESGIFNNYRLYMKTYDGADQVLFNVSGSLHKDGHVVTLWQSMELPRVRYKPGEGNLPDSATTKEVNLPGGILSRVNESVDSGNRDIPDEVVNLTIMFASLDNPGERDGITDHQGVMEILNLAFNLMVHSIRRFDGKVEKFMGDAVMASFKDARQAVSSAVHIQNQFTHLNMFRSMSDAPPIYARIGLNSGNVILGNVGVKDLKEWTPVGDVVNTASRIEASADRGSVLISEDTYTMVKDHVMVDRYDVIRGNGKRKDMNVMRIVWISSFMDGAPVTLKVDVEGYGGLAGDDRYFDSLK